MTLRAHRTGVARPVLAAAACACLVAAGCIDGDSGPYETLSSADGAGGAGGPGAGEAAAARAGLTVETPGEGEVVLKRRVRFTGSVSAGGPAQPGVGVTVGGVPADVDGDGRWSLAVDLQDGAHEITVVGLPMGLEVVRRFLVDTRPPEILLPSPDRALWHQPDVDGAEVVFRGAAWDAATGVTEVSVGGEPVALGGKGEFEHPWRPAPGLSTVVVLATDGAGHTSKTTRSILSGKFAPAALPVDDAFEVAMGAAALQAIADAIEQVVEAQALDALVRQGGGGDFEVRDVRYDRMDIELTPDFGGFRVVVRVFGLRVHVAVRQRVLFATVTLTGHADANPAELTGFISMTVTNDGAVAVALADPGVALHDFRIDIDNLPGFLEGWLSDMVRDFAEGAIEDALRDLVFPELFDPSDLVQTLDIGGRTVVLDIRLTLLTISPDGLRLRARTQARSDSVGLVAPHPGRYLTDRPAAPPAPPGGGDPAVRISIMDDAINQILHTVWACGALDLRGAVPAGADLPLALDVQGIGSLMGGDLTAAAPADSPVQIAVKPLLPPVWMAADHGGDTLARVGLGDAFLSFIADTPGGPVPLVSIVFGALYDVGIPAAPGEPAPIVGADIQADLFGEAVDLDDERAEEAIEGLLTLAAPLIGDLLADAVDRAGGGDAGAGGLGGGQGFLSSDGAGMIVDLMAPP